MIAKLFTLFSLCFILNFPALANIDVTLFFNDQSSRVQFAVSEIQEAIKENNGQAKELPISALSDFMENEFIIVFLNAGTEQDAEVIAGNKINNVPKLKTEGFILKKIAKKILIVSKETAGLMYGGLEVAELIKTGGIESVEDQLQNPYMKVRGTKFNIPLDVRTPTYTEPCDAAQKNMEEMWNFDFWKDYIDNLARYRYNTISLWNMHPFPSMVKVPEYPDVALDDVRKSTVDWEENYELNGWGFDAPEIVNNYAVIKKMTIDEKIEFWRNVMAYGKARNVQFFILTWNIFDYGVGGKYGIDDKLENPVTTDYFRQSIKQMVLTYPDLAGIGLTTGENMYNYTNEQKEEWAFATYGQGIIDALKEQPDRNINLIHRQHQTNAGEVKNIFREVMNNENINFIFSFKYAKAHVYSSIDQVYHHDFVEDIESENIKTLWTLRNDDIFYFRWGAPNFVRDFIKNLPYDVSEGWYYGSDQYVWGREFLDKHAGDESRKLEIVKHWYQWMIWGRLGYNPDMSNDRFVDYIQYRFPETNAEDLFDAWQNASMIYPWVTGFHWGALDFQWYIESGQGRPFVSQTPSGYHDVNHFIRLKPHSGTDNISIPNYTKAFLNGEEMEGDSPIDVAEKILESTEKALNWVAKQDMVMSPELRKTVDDIATISLLGKYYAHKILASTYLSLFRENFEKEWYDKTIDELNMSAGYWRHFTAMALFNHKNPLWTNRVGYVDWKKNFAHALYEITVQGGGITLPSMEITAGGTILEAEAAEFNSDQIGSDIKGFTGSGYIPTKSNHSNYSMNWTYNAAEAGKYLLEFRYTLTRERTLPGFLKINGKQNNDLTFWDTGNPGAWVWERVVVNLKKGENIIEISPEAYVKLDHLNIIQY
ncbi:MAG: hypothetical protein WD577_04050 [Bacteroidales bacterium]